MATIVTSVERFLPSSKNSCSLCLGEAELLALKGLQRLGMSDLLSAQLSAEEPCGSCRSKENNPNEKRDGNGLKGRWGQEAFGRCTAGIRQSYMKLQTEKTKIVVRLTEFERHRRHAKECEGTGAPRDRKAAAGTVDKAEWPDSRA